MTTPAAWTPRFYVVVGRDKTGTIVDTLTWRDGQPFPSIGMADSCQESPRCPHDNLVLMWREDTWVCDGPIGCGDEWSTDVFPVPSLDSGLH